MNFGLRSPLDKSVGAVIALAISHVKTGLGRFVVASERILEVKPEDLDQANDLRAQWQKECNHDAVFHTYADMDDLWKQMIEKSGIPLFSTITSGEHSIMVFGDKEQPALSLAETK